MWTFELVIIEAVQISESYQQNSFILGKILPRNSRGSSKFQITLTKLLYFWEKGFLVIIRPVQTFKWNHQNCFILWKISACDNRGRSNFWVTSSKLPIFAKLSALGNRASSKVQVTSKLFFEQKFQLVIAAAVLQFCSAEMT